MELAKELIVQTDLRFASRPAATAEMLKIVGVDPKWANYVRVLDQQENLCLLHYLNTVVSQENPVLNEQAMKEIGHVRGTIVDLDNHEIVCQSLPFTPEAVADDSARVAELLPTLQGASMYSACEGTIVRLYYHTNEWHVSTHRKLDASASSWAGPTFGAMFDEAKQFDVWGLDKTKCYVFLLSHPKNRLVYKIDRPQLMLVALYDRTIKQFVAQSSWGSLPTGVSQPLQLDGITDAQSLAAVTTAMAEQQRFDRAGVIVFPAGDQPRPVKIINTQYFLLRNARGNEPSMRMRYLQLRGQPESMLLANWYCEPEYREAFIAAEQDIANLVKRLHGMYIHRYIKKNFDTLPKEEFVVLQRCHSWHTTDRVNNIVTQTKVQQMINETPNVYVIKMLSRP